MDAGARNSARVVIGDPDVVVVFGFECALEVAVLYLSIGWCGQNHK